MESNLFFLSFVYICVAVGDLVIERGGDILLPGFTPPGTRDIFRDVLMCSVS